MPEELDLPKELEEALVKNPTAKAIWDALTVRKRRQYARDVASAETSSEKIERVTEILNDLLHPPS